VLGVTKCLCDVAVEGRGMFIRSMRSKLDLYLVEVDGIVICPLAQVRFVLVDVGCSLRVRHRKT